MALRKITCGKGNRKGSRTFSQVLDEAVEHIQNLVVVAWNWLTGPVTFQLSTVIVWNM